MRKHITMVAVVAALVTGASLTVPAVAREKAAETPKEKIVIAAPPAGKGQVVFFRTGGTGFALGCGVNENGERISALGSGKYFVHPTTPGSHSYTVKSEATDLLTLEVEAGETTYVRCKIKMGIMVGRPNISPSTAEEFEAASHKLEYVDADDIGPKKDK